MCSDHFPATAYNRPEFKFRGSTLKFNALPVLHSSIEKEEKSGTNEFGVQHFVSCDLTICRHDASTQTETIAFKQVRGVQTRRQKPPATVTTLQKKINVLRLRLRSLQARHRNSILRLRRRKIDYHIGESLNMNVSVSPELLGFVVFRRTASEIIMACYL